MNLKGIDVSKWQGNIDWKKVKNAGIRFAMIRGGYGKDYPSQKDKFFEKNYAGCKENGIPCGLYWYSYAESADAINREAEACLKCSDGKQFEYPIVLDAEGGCMLKFNKATVSDWCQFWCNIVESNKCYAMIYCNFDWYKNKIDGDELSKKYDFWIAHWNAAKPSKICGIWQYSDAGKIDGISVNVDLNEAFKDYPTIMKNQMLKRFFENFRKYSNKKFSKIF